MSREPSGRDGGKGGAAQPKDCSAQPNDGPAETHGQRSTTRRGLLGALGAVGVGLGSAGVLLGERDASRGPPRSSGGATDTRPATARGEDGQETAESRSSPGQPVIGANLNGRPHRVLDRLELIDASETSWVRAFFDVREKLEDGTDPESDPDVLALGRLARERDCKLVVSLKWDFSAAWNDKDPMNVPPPGSNGERALLECATRYLSAIGSPVDVVVLGNEPMWETLEADIRVEEPPIVRFTRNVKAHLARHGDHGDPTYLVGAFNRAHDAATREDHFQHFFLGMFDLVREDEDVDGIDLHVHYGRFSEAEETVAVARAALPDATITATEFSPVWRYYRHVHSPIDDSEAGDRFARENDLPRGMTAVEYFEYAKRNPRPPEELADFYEAMPWYNVNHVADIYDLFDAFDVEVGTFGLLADRGMRRVDWTSGWSPFHINFLFQPALISIEDGLGRAANLHYLEDYRERAGREE